MPISTEGTGIRSFFRGSIFRSGILMAAILGLLSGCQKQGAEISLGSGPPGGTFEKIAAGMAQVLNEDIPDVRVAVKPSGGSLANLREVEQGQLSMGLVFSGDAYLGWKGRLKENMAPTKEVRAVARLYGATAQLVVPGQSSVQTLGDLPGRRVAIGGSGTGSALTASRFFRSVGLWNQIIPIHEGYATGMEDLKMGNIDAVWLEVGFPNEYLLGVSREIPLRFLDLAPAAEAGNFFSLYPFYSPALIPAGTYRGQGKDILTFQDAALWVANAEVNEDLVYGALRALFSAKGLEQMWKAHPAAWDMTLKKGLQGVKIPLHSGARRFWQEKGMIRDRG
jgi:TRAP transporter TAXI family solute receptor